MRRLRFVIGTDPPAADDAHVRAAAGPPKKTRRRKRRRVYRKLFEEDAAEENGTFTPVESVHFQIGDGKQAKDEFEQRTGGGIGGSKWVAALLPKDFKPPVDLRWPEYVRTERGREWWIPTPNE